jgi:hypothetical protein
MARRNQWKQAGNDAKKEKGLLGPFTEALKTVGLIEERAIHALVPINFTMEDVFDIVLSPEHKDLVKRAFGIVTTSYGRQVIYLAPYNAIINFDQDDYKMARFDPSICQEVPKDSLLGVALDQIMDISNKYDRVRDVVKWFNKNATVGAARYYWPSMCALLPAEHDIHSCGGDKFRDIPGVSSMINKFRETAPIVAGAAMLPEKKDGRNSVILHYGEGEKTVGLL